MERDSFVFYRSFYEAIRRQPKKVQADIYNTIADYALNGTEPTQASDAVLSIFLLIKPQIDANNHRYTAGKKGGRPSKTDSNKKEEKTKTVDSEKEGKTETYGFEKEEKTETYGFENRAEKDAFEKPNENVNVNEKPKTITASTVVAAYHRLCPSFPAVKVISYTLKGMSDSQEETLEIAAGDTVKWNFKEWYVVPKDSCVTDVEITVPADASFYLDGVQVGKKYLKKTADNVSIYKIPYLFLGGHTIELTEKQKDPYREIVLVQDNSSMEFLPDLKLNDSTGKTIADRTEESLDKVFTAAAAGKSFSTIKNEFSADTAVQKTAKEQYQQLCDAYLNSDTNTGITSITVSSVSTTVTNESNQMKIETNVTAAIERRTRFLHFFRKTKIETVTWKLESVVTLENEKWVMGSDFLTKIGHEA